MITRSKAKFAEGKAGDALLAIKEPYKPSDGEEIPSDSGLKLKLDKTIRIQFSALHKSRATWSINQSGELSCRFIYMPTVAHGKIINVTLWVILLKEKLLCHIEMTQNRLINRHLNVFFALPTNEDENAWLRLLDQHCDRLVEPFSRHSNR